MAAELPLSGKIAVVAGATRGAGRGIARGLGEAGALVYCTGRSTTGSPSPYDRPETLEETAAMVEDLGGTAVVRRVDHTIEEEVEALFAEVEAEHGRVDVLVNSIGGEDPAFGGWGSFWEADLSKAVEAVDNGMVSHIITAKHAARRMKEQGNGLIVEVTDGDLPGGGGANLLSQVTKAAGKSMVRLMAWELREHGVAVVAVSPGFLRSEKMLEHFGVTEENWQDGGAKDEYFLHSESPLFVGRGIAALAAAPDLMARTGELTSSWRLVREFGFTDYDGRAPDFGRQLEIAFSGPEWRPTMESETEFLERMTERARRYLGEG